MVKDYSQWNLSESGRDYSYNSYKINGNTTYNFNRNVNISESWDALGNSNLNKLDEHSYTSAISRDEFINEAFPALNESADEYTKDKVYALYETQLFYTHREDWFNTPYSSNQAPLILEAENHYIIIHSDKSFAITKESYDILMNNDINEGFLGDLWDGIKDAGSAIGDFFSDAYDAVKSRLGKWADSISDAAKSVVGFMGTCVQAVGAFLGSDWLTMVQTLSSLVRGVFGTVGSFLFPGTAGLVTSVVGGATGLLGLYAGYDRIAKPYGEIEGIATKAKDPKELGGSLAKIGPELISGTSNMMVGAKDIINAISPSDSSPLAGISDVAALFSKDTKDDLAKQGKELFSEGNTEAIGKTLFAMANVNEASAPVDLAKSLKTNMLTMSSVVSLEYVVPGIKDNVLEGSKSVSDGVKTALEIPQTINEFLGGAKKNSKEEGGSAGILGSALGFIRKPIVNGLTSFCDAVKGPVESATAVVGGIPDKFDTVLKSIDKNDVDIDLGEIEIPETEEVEAPDKMVKLKKDDIEAIKTNKDEIMKLKESKCVDFDTWSKYNS
jgi:hypothetical protein